MMKVYLVPENKVNDFTRTKGSIKIEPEFSKKGYFLTMNLVELWSELDWKSLETIELLEEDLIHEDIKEL